MPEWLFWAAMAVMLAAGRLAGVGLFLDRFALGAAAAALSAPLGASLEQQLNLFLLASAAALAISRIARSRKAPGAS